RRRRPADVRRRGDRGSGESSPSETPRRRRGQSGKIAYRVPLPMRSSTSGIAPRELWRRSEHPVITAFKDLQLAAFHPVIETDIEQQVIEVSAIVIDKVDHRPWVLQPL